MHSHCSTQTIDICPLFMLSYRPNVVPTLILNVEKGYGNNKVRTMFTAELRYEGHCRPSSGCRKLSEVIQRDGPSAFTVTTLEDGILNQGLANEREIELIKVHNSRSDPDNYESSGFNLTDGGAGTRDESTWLVIHSKVVEFSETHRRMPRNNADDDDERNLYLWVSRQWQFSFA